MVYEMKMGTGGVRRQQMNKNRVSEMEKCTSVNRQIYSIYIYIYIYIYMCFCYFVPCFVSPFVWWVVGRGIQ